MYTFIYIYVYILCIIFYPYQIFHVPFHGNTWTYAWSSPAPPTQVETAVRATLLAAFPGVVGAGPLVEVSIAMGVS